MNSKSTKIPTFLKFFCLSFLLLTCQIIFSVSPLTITASAEESEAKVDNKTVDFVLVLDQSNSLAEGEKELLLDAANLFIDMLPTENARLSVITFGKDYGSEAFDFGSDDDFDMKSEYPLLCKYVREIYPLTDITTVANKDDVQNRIVEALSTSGNQTPIGPGLQAAYETLVKGNAEEGRAAVILMTDGQVQQGNCAGDGTKDKFGDGYEYHSIDHAGAHLGDSGWPVYSLELNMGGKNDNGNGDPGIARRQMRDNIPTLTHGENIILNTAEDAEAAFTKIVANFFNVNLDSASVLGKEIPAGGGQVDMSFEIGELVAESNVTIISQQMNVVTEIIATGPDNRQYKFKPSDKVDESTNYALFGMNYSVLKLFSPNTGTWTITVKGTEEAKLDLYAVSIREMDLQISCSEITDERASYPKGYKATFNAQFNYKNHPYISESVYEKYPAELIIIKDGIESRQLMEANESYYVARDIAFTESGHYQVYASVSGDNGSGENIFTGGVKESGQYSFSIDNQPPKTIKDMPDVELKLNESITLDCQDYFTDEDDKESLKFTFDTDQHSANIQGTFEKGRLTIKASDIATNDCTATVTASDGGAMVSLNFKITVINQPMELSEGFVDGQEMKFEFTFNADKVPGFLLKMIDVPTEPSWTYNWYDCCIDSDGIDPVVKTTVVAADEAMLLEEPEAGTTTFTATGAGEAIYEVALSDASDNSIAYKINVQVKSWDAKKLIWMKIRVPFFILLAIIIITVILLIIAFGGRKIYGVWEISCNGDVQKNKKISITTPGKKKQCNLDEVLRAFNCPTGFENVKLAATNNFTKGVIVKGKGLDQCQSIRYNNKAKKSSRYKIAKNQSITLVNKQEYEVKLTRKR